MQISLRRLYRVTSLVWVLVAAGLCLSTWGSVLLSVLAPMRAVVSVLAALMALGMLVRAFVPGKPQWTRWTLPLMGSTSVATFFLALFASNIDGGYTISRIGYSLLLLSPALFAYTFWVGERVVVGR
jgi:uncharacterized membrane protein YhhN